MSQNNLPETEGESVGNGLAVVSAVDDDWVIRYEIFIYFVICNSEI